MPRAFHLIGVAMDDPNVASFRYDNRVEIRRAAERTAKRASEAPNQDTHLPSRPIDTNGPCPS
jgi:hypothetical protein